LTEKTSNPEFEAFDRTMGKILSVSHDELKRRMEAYNKQMVKNPNKRGPKPQTKSRALSRGQVR
jgi:hypothetical protein